MTVYYFLIAWTIPSGLDGRLERGTGRSIVMKFVTMDIKELPGSPATTQQTQAAISQGALMHSERRRGATGYAECEWKSQAQYVLSPALHVFTRKAPNDPERLEAGPHMLAVSAHSHTQAWCPRRRWRRPMGAG